MSDVVIPDYFLTEFEERRAMSSFENLFQLAKDKPRACRKMLQKMARTEEAYPVDLGVIYLLGMLQGILESQRTHLDGIGQVTVLEAVCEAHKDMSKFKPCDYIGPKRKIGKTGLYPPDPEPKGK